MAQCQPSNAFGHITKSPSYSPFISNCLENKLINTSMIFPEKSEKSQDFPDFPHEIPQIWHPFSLKKNIPWFPWWRMICHDPVPRLDVDLKIGFVSIPKKNFWKAKWYNPVNLWLHEISDNQKKIGGYFTISFISKSWRNWGSNSCWPWLTRSRPRRVLRSRVWWSHRPPSTTLAPLITPYFSTS